MENTEKKGGRPPKKLSERKKYQICLKLKTEEEYTLRSRCKQASLSKQEYLRQSILNSVVVQRINPETSDIIRKLCGMANNLNQIAKKANQIGYSGIREEYLFLAESIDNLINHIRYDSENINRK